MPVDYLDDCQEAYEWSPSFAAGYEAYGDCAYCDPQPDAPSHVVAEEWYAGWARAQEDAEAGYSAFGEWGDL